MNEEVEETIKLLNNYEKFVKTIIDGVDISGKHKEILLLLMGINNPVFDKLDIKNLVAVNRQIDVFKEWLTCR